MKQKVKEISLVKDLGDKSINYKKYEDLFCGFEFEFNSDKTGREIARHFDVGYGKTDGKGKTKVTKRIMGGGEITFDIDADLYNKTKYVTQVYPDGSVPFEVVTRPIQLKELDAIKREVFDYLVDDCEADFFDEGKGGLHLTFLTNHHADLSRFDRVVVQNLIQLTRMYYREIIELFPGKNDRTRKLEYRKLPTYEQSRNPGCSGSKYYGINPRRGNDGNIWAIEVRLPDGTNNWNLINKQVRFWMAMIRHSAIISKYGLIEIPAKMWDKQKRWYTNNYSPSAYTINPTTRIN